jgi:hypothetical protein
MTAATVGHESALARELREAYANLTATQTRCNVLLEESRELRRAVHALAPLGETLAELGQDERRVILVLARRLLEGQKAYGRLSLATDPRDFRHERAMEIADLLVYSAFAELQQATRAQ